MHILGFESNDGDIENFNIYSNLKDLNEISFIQFLDAVKYKNSDSNQVMTFLNDSE